MTKNKTLKDLECKGETHGYRERWISETELKREAIKWVNFARDTKFNISEWPNEQFAKGFAWALFYFFNLTEEDLK
jgi:hypothetical protein